MIKLLKRTFSAKIQKKILQRKNSTSNQFASKWVCVETNLQWDGSA